MRFRVVHETAYVYTTPAMETVCEMRLCPLDGMGQKVLSRKLEIDPEVPVQSYTDYFGNVVEYFSVARRLNKLRVKVLAEVLTEPVKPPGKTADVTLGEARMVYRSRRSELYPFLAPTSSVPLGQVLRPIRKRFFYPQRSVRKVAQELNGWIYKNFKYVPGVTDVTTPVSQVVSERRGVCQDFAHLMLAFLRTHGVPARYVSGYIEPNDPTVADSELIGAAASHAWVEVFLPDGSWWGLDPTNNQTASERHVRVAVGRDYTDVTPLRGTYKGAIDQKLKVMVRLQRKNSTATSQKRAGKA